MTPHPPPPYCCGPQPPWPPSYLPGVGNVGFPVGGQSEKQPEIVTVSVTGMVPMVMAEQIELLVVELKTNGAVPVLNGGTAIPVRGAPVKLGEKAPVPVGCG